MKTHNVFGFVFFKRCQDLPQETDDGKKATSTQTQEPEQKVPSTNSSMRIAWRYQSQPKFEVSLLILQVLVTFYC